MGSIVLKKQGRNSYYVYQESYRQKVNASDSGKVRGSGKSRVCTRTVYLGTAEKILQCFQEKRKPVEVKVRHFGLVAAACQTARLIELQKILMKYIPGVRYGVPRWIYFFVTVINRLDHATSKNKMSGWLKKTILPELLGFDENKLASRNFWRVTDDIICEKDLKEKRKEENIKDDLFTGIDDAVFTSIEAELFNRIDELIGISPEIICYDTTNFYTYIDEPKRSELANTCHSKASKHHLKHIGLLMAVEKTHGIPLFNRIYPANCHDSKVFSFILSNLVISLKKVCNQDSGLILVLDKGNNKDEVFESMSGDISWIGSLVPSHHNDLVEIDISKYHGVWNGKNYYRCERVVMGVECVIVLVFNPLTARKREYSLKRGIEKLKTDISNKWKNYKNTPKKITPGIISAKNKSIYGKCFSLSVRDGHLVFEENEENKKEIENKRKYFGKNLVFSNKPALSTGYLIDTYIEKNIIEEDFHVLKDVTIIRFTPIRHWTDTKIRAYAFCCVLSMTLIRVMQWMTEQIGYKMSPNVLKEELSDIQEVVMMYSATEAERQISQRSAVQQKLWDVFKLEKIEKQLSLH